MKIRSLGILVVFVLSAFGTGVSANAAGVAVFQTPKKIRENVSTLMLLRMTNALELTEEQTTKIYPKVSAVEKQKALLNREISSEMRSLRSLLSEKNPDEKNIQLKVDAVKDLRNNVRALENDLETFLSENLSVIQRGKYLFFIQEFNRNLREQLNRARALQKKQKRNPRKSERPGPYF